ncbi:ribonucleotide-diphosphate reductase subunit beta [Bacterioplanoides sp.]|uniref:ribonucleotide-diphosphate reductase subunit beta n=1 Tax=Bacterioplanoides sp. TaxID=2066072 RepID=UPI003AFF669C
MPAGVLTPSVTYKPFRYPWAMELAEASEKAHWGTWELDLQKDVEQIKTGALTAGQMNHIVQILRLFTQTDVVVGGNYCEMFIPHFKNNEIRNMLLSIASREGTHQRAYALLNDTLGMADSEYSAFLEYEAMAEKVEFMQQADLSTDEGLVLSVAQTVCNEGMSLFSAFAMLLNYERFGLMRGMCEVVEWSVKDETLHVIGMAKVFHTLCEELPHVVTDDFKFQIYEMFRTAVSLEDKVIDIAFEMGPIEGLTADEVKQFIRHIADRRLTMLGMKTIYGVDENPLPWINSIIAGDSFKNFFEGRVTDYTNGSLTGEWTYPS